MKFQPKRFVVEVKRGTSRAAFASPDPVADRFSNAEAMLFGGATKGQAKADQSSSFKDDASSGRVLRSLVEPPPPVAEEPAAPVRRGRKPGSKNKPKVHPTPDTPAAGIDVLAERPRRGRKPGSKNKPKSPTTMVAPSSVQGGPSSVADMMRNYGFGDEEAAWQDEEVSDVAQPDETASARVRDESAPRLPRPRLRDRSTILKRYVLDVEPRPGQPGSLRARRLARAARV